MLISGHLVHDVDFPRVGVSLKARAEIGKAVSQPDDLNTGIRVVEVENLGWECALCEIEGETVLFLDVHLSQDERVDIMTDVMSGRY